MKRVLLLTIAVLCYLSFARVGVYLVGFVADLWVPKTIDRPALAWNGSENSGRVFVLAASNTFWLLLFCCHHSLAARRFYKRRVERVLPRELERSSYVLVSSLLLAALMYFWHPIPIDLWQVSGRVEGPLRYGGLLGWVLAVSASRSLGHGRVFGVRPAWRLFRKGGSQSTAAAETGEGEETGTGRVEAEPLETESLETRRLYGLLRHPMYLGFLFAIWVSPRMTVGHFLFASVLTVYVYLGSRLEEADLLSSHGAEFESYRATVGGFWPRPWRPGR